MQIIYPIHCLDIAIDMLYLNSLLLELVMLYQVLGLSVGRVCL